MRKTLAALALAAVTVSGCSGGSKAPAPATAASRAGATVSGASASAPQPTDLAPVDASVFKAALAKAAEARTAKVTMSMTVAATGQNLTKIVSSGVTSLGAPIRSRMSMSYATMGEQVRFEVLITPTDLYVKFPEESKKRLGGKLWARQSLDDASAAAGVSLEELVGQAGRVSPLESMNLLIAAGDTRVVGNETIRGTATVHYSGTLTREAIELAYTGELRAQVTDLLESMGAEPAPFDLWLDSNGLPRRMRQSTKTTDAHTELAMEILEYGVALDVEPPPADETEELAVLMQRPVQS